MPVMTFLNVPKPYSGLRSAGKSLNPVATTTAPTSTSITWSRARRSMHDSTGQASTHSPHSEQTPQSRHRPAPRRASASVMGSSTSRKSTGAALSTSLGSAGDRQRGRSSGGPGPAALSTTGSRRSNPSSGSPPIQRSIMWAARWPWPVARVMSEAPETTSPAAKSHGVALCSVSASTDDPAARSAATWPAKRCRVGGHADGRDDHVAVDVEVAAGDGLGPASGRSRRASPAPCGCSAGRATAPVAVVEHLERAPPGRRTRRPPSRCRRPRRGGPASRPGCGGRRR